MYLLGVLPKTIGRTEGVYVSKEFCGCSEGGFEWLNDEVYKHNSIRSVIDSVYNIICIDHYITKLCSVGTA